MKKINANIIINTYNGNQKELLLAVNSCLNQKKCNIKLIVSTVYGDPSIKTLDDFNLKIVKSKKPGIYSQLNAAVKEITEEWWCYMSGNDIAYPEKIFSEVSCCLSNNAKICYSAFDRYDLFTKKLSRKSFHNYSFEKHLEGNFVTDVATMHKSVSDEYGPFLEEFDNLGYWDFWLRVGQNHPEYFTYNKNPTFKYVVSSESRHVKRKNNKKWQEKEFKDRVKMLKRFGPLRGIYKEGF